MEVKILKNKNDKEDIPSSDPVKIEFKDGLKVQYHKEDLRKFYPHLMEEIENETDFPTEDHISSMEGRKKVKSTEQNIQKQPDELINPGATDFIRRCKDEKEAIEILDYLKSRKEISKNEYDKFIARINKKNGLKELIEECGGFKQPGYYEKKYYKKNINNQK
jgi:hypothetical protein